MTTLCRFTSRWLMLCAGVVLLLPGCASVSVRKTAQTRGPARPPAKIYVEDFDTRSGKWEITSRSLSRPEFKRKLAYALAEDTAKDLRRFVGPASRLSRRDAPVPAGSWIVSGRFTRVSEGSPAGRIILGLGVGASKIETEGAIATAEDRAHPFLRFSTSGGSNAMPGALFNTNALSVVTTGIGQIKLGVKDDANRTGKMVAAEILEYEHQRGWKTKVPLKPKRPGKFQLLQPQVSPATKQPRAS